MSMHMLGPAWTTTGKKKSKRKFKNAEAAAKARANAESWKRLLEKWDVKQTKNETNSSRTSSRVIRDGSDTRHIPSLDSGSGNALKKEIPTYTGDAMIGIGQLHKSNAIPIFQAEDAVDISKMRRG